MNMMKLMVVARGGGLNQQQEDVIDYATTVSGSADCFAITTGTPHEIDVSSFWTLRGLYHAGPFDHPLKKALIVPATPVLGWKGLKEPWSMRISGRKGESPFVSIRSGQWTVTAKAIDGKYPAWREVIPRYPVSYTHLRAHET